MLQPGLLGTMESFAQRYCRRPETLKPGASPQPIKSPGGRGGAWSSPAARQKMEMGGAQCLTELQAVLARTVMIRRLKDDVLPSLPPKTR